MPEREATDPYSVLAGIVRGRRQPEVVDLEDPGETVFMNDRGLVAIPGPVRVVDAGDDERLVVDGDQRTDAVRGDHLRAAYGAASREIVAGRTGGPDAAGGGGVIGMPP